MRRIEMSIRTAALFGGVIITQSLWVTSLSSLISLSSTIVVGTESAPIQTGKVVTFYLQVERVLSGTIQAGSTVSVVWKPRMNIGWLDIYHSYRGIWLLRKAADGNWECLSAGSSGNAEFFPELSLPVSDGPLPPQLAYSADTTPLPDQIVLEMAGGKPGADPMMILGIVSDMRSPGILRAFRFLASSAVADQVYAGLSGLIESGDTEGLLLAEAKSGTLTAAAGADWIASAIRLNFRSSDPVAVASLGRMATAGDASPLVRDAAAYALAAIHSRAAVPWLGSLLSSSSIQMQTYAAEGLSYFVNGVGIPTAQSMPGLDHLNHRQLSTYRTPETERNIGYRTGQAGPFIEFWQAWWRQHTELHAQL